MRPTPTEMKAKAARDRAADWYESVGRAKRGRQKRSLKQFSRTSLLVALLREAPRDSASLSRAAGTPKRLGQVYALSAGLPAQVSGPT